MMTIEPDTLMNSLSPTIPGCFLNNAGAKTNWLFVFLLVQQTGEHLIQLLS